MLMGVMRRRASVALAAFAIFVGGARAEETLFVYGPGGPAPAMKEVAEVFGKAHGVKVEVTAGPTDKWGWLAR
jgi:accessory colonization factor AcfC